VPRSKVCKYRGPAWGGGKKLALQHVFKLTMGNLSNKYMFGGFSNIEFVTQTAPVLLA